MVIIKKSSIYFFLIFIISVIHTNAQKTYINTDPDYNYKKGLALFEEGLYGEAQKHFDKAVELYDKVNTDYKANAEFYSSLCAIELFNGDAEYLITQFISKYPESPKARLANFEMGKFRYRQQDYKQAINWFEKVDKTKLPSEFLPEYYFKLGYSYFMEEEYNNASKCFFEIKDVDTKYTSPAVYYYSHIAYSKENYETALKGFQKLEKDETFSPVVPYYITQILFLQRKYNEVIAYSPKFIKSATTKRVPEIARIVGESFFRLKEYEKALPYLELFDDKTKKKTREDKYLLAYTYYYLNKYKQASDLFELITGENDLLSQNSYYHIADCYLKLNEKTKARLAFSAASKMNFDEKIKEDALYNYAKITFELRLTPFNDAIQAFNEYIQLYPNSNKIDEIYNYLTMAFLNTKNYKDAMLTIENIKSKDNKIKEAYQRVAFFRGLELFNNLEYQEAILAFDKSLTYFWFDKKIKARSIYWKAEASYRLNNYDTAIVNFNDFILSTGAFSLDEFNTAHYNLGYCYYKKKSYEDALTWFRKYVNLSEEEKSIKLCDAFNRIGDCYFVLRKYWLAAENYDKAVEIGMLDIDYTLYQRGFVFGLVDRPNKKINSLTRLINEYPNSSFYDDALFELGKTYLQIKDNDQAEIYLKKLVDDYITSPFLNQAMLQLGIIYYNKNNNEEALTCFKKIVQEFPGSPEAKNALTGIKNIYVDLNDVKSYFNYVQDLGEGEEVTAAEQDSLTYIAAENVYITGDCDKSITNFENYIQQFPNGNFIINSHYYNAECYYLKNELGSALNSYEYVIAKPKNNFTELSLLRAAQIHNRMGNYEKAYHYYNELEISASTKNILYESRLGLMRTAVKLNDNRKIIESCDKVLITEQIPVEIQREAQFLKATALYKSGKLNDALTIYRIISTEVISKEGAESKYMVAKILFQLKVIDKAKLEIMDFISKGTSHQYWLAKSIILLSDIHHLNKDNFQAKATLQSLIDNYQNTEDGIIDEANQKILTLIKQEKEKEYVDKQEEIKLKFEDNKDGKYDGLFENEINSDTINNTSSDTMQLF